MPTPVLLGSPQSLFAVWSVAGWTVTDETLEVLDKLKDDSKSRTEKTNEKFGKGKTLRTNMRMKSDDSL